MPCSLHRPDRPECSINSHCRPTEREADIDGALRYYAFHRPHAGLGGGTPNEALAGDEPRHLRAVHPPRGRRAERCAPPPFVIDFFEGDHRLPSSAPLNPASEPDTPAPDERAEPLRTGIPAALLDANARASRTRSRTLTPSRRFQHQQTPQLDRANSHWNGTLTSVSTALTRLRPTELTFECSTKLPLPAYRHLLCGFSQEALPKRLAASHSFDPTL
jgi:hypothetical protein